jgi:hypothetical protein
MKNLQTMVIFILVALSLVSCSNSSTNEGAQSIGTLRNIKTAGIKSLYTVDYSVETDNNRAISQNNTILTLAYVSNGKNTPIIFQDSKNQDIILKISNIRNVNGSWIIAEFTGLYAGYENTNGEFMSTYQENRSGKTIMDMKTGVLYDFTPYAIDNVIIVDDTIYTTDIGWNSPYSKTTLYKITLGTNIQAIPLNNKDYDSAGKLNFIIGNKIIAGFKFYNSGGDLQTYGKSFDTNGIIQPKQVNIPTDHFFGYRPSELESPYNIIIGYVEGGYIIEEGLEEGGKFLDKNGDTWVYTLHPEFIKLKISINDDGLLGYSDYSETPLSYEYDWVEHILPGGRHIGFPFQPRYFVTIVSSGTDLQLNYDPTGLRWLGEMGIQNSNGYWFYTAENNIYKVDLNTLSYESIYSGNIFTLHVSGNAIIFDVYANATTINTYMMPVEGPYSPTLFSVNRSEIKDILELIF